jgi:hypothetical protein
MRKGEQRQSETCSRVTLCTTNLKQTALGFNMDLVVRSQHTDPIKK